MMNQLSNPSILQAAGIWATYNLFDLGLSKTLALETLSHSTGPLGFVGIIRTGGDPKKGGSDKGSCGIYPFHLKVTQMGPIQIIQIRRKSYG